MSSLGNVVEQSREPWEPEVKIAGRCLCGVLLDLVAREPRGHRYCAPAGHLRCMGPCGRVRPESEFWPNRRWSTVQSLCKDCGRRSSSDSYTRRYRDDPEFRERERARRRSSNAQRKTVPYSPSRAAVER